MNKIPTALVRDPNNRAKVLPEITPGCEWVFAGEGVPTRKWDGTCVMLDDNYIWWARREVKPGKDEPEGFIKIHYDEITGKTQGWEPIDQSSFAKFHTEALGQYNSPDEFYTYRPGTYELVGPKINGNPDRFEGHYLLKHSESPAIPGLIAENPRNLINILEAYCGYGAEGVVWHHPDGRMAKLKGRDL